MHGTHKWAKRKTLCCGWPTAKRLWIKALRRWTNEQAKRKWFGGRRDLMHLWFFFVALPLPRPLSLALLFLPVLHLGLSTFQYQIILSAINKKNMKPKRSLHQLLRPRVRVRSIGVCSPNAKHRLCSHRSEANEEKRAGKKEGTKLNRPFENSTTGRFNWSTLHLNACQRSWP